MNKILRILSAILTCLSINVCCLADGVQSAKLSASHVQIKPSAAVNAAHANSVSPLAQSSLFSWSSGSLAIPTVTTLDGKSFDIGADHGYKVIYFYSNACPCVRNCETLTFKPLAQQYQGKVSFYAVVSGGWDLHDNRGNFLALLATHHLPFPVYLDNSHAVADLLGGHAASQAVLLSPDNKVLYNGAADDSKDFTDANGHLGHSKTYLADAITQTLAGQPVAVPYVMPIGCSIAK